VLKCVEIKIYFNIFQHDSSCLSVFKALWTSWFNSLLGIKVGVQGFGGPSRAIPGHLASSRHYELVAHRCPYQVRPLWESWAWWTPQLQRLLVVAYLLVVVLSLVKSGHTSGRLRFRFVCFQGGFTHWISRGYLPTEFPGGIYPLEVMRRNFEETTTLFFLLKQQAKAIIINNLLLTNLPTSFLWTY